MRKTERWNVQHNMSSWRPVRIRNTRINNSTKVCVIMVQKYTWFFISSSYEATKRSKLTSSRSFSRIISKGAALTTVSHLTLFFQVIEMMIMLTMIILLFYITRQATNHQPTSVHRPLSVYRTETWLERV